MSNNISITRPGAFVLNFPGKAPAWYKNIIFAFLVINPVVAGCSMFAAGWLLLAEFIFTLALECHPLESRRPADCRSLPHRHV